MSKILSITRRECLNLIGKPAFWISLFVVPLLVGILIVVVIATGAGAAAASAATREQESKTQGVVDNTGILRDRPAVLAAHPQLKPYADEAAARAALADKSINSYFVVDAGFVETGRVRYVAETFSPIDSEDRVDTIEHALQLALFDGDAARADRFRQPLDIGEATNLAPADPGRDLPFSPVPLIAGFVFMGSLLGSSTYLMQSVTTERESRVIEVLISSVTAKQLLIGKILGLGVVGFLQLAVWLISTFSALPTLRAVPAIAPYLESVTFASIGWSVLYFVVGYFIFAALMAGVGALVPNMKDGSSYSFLVMLPLLIPMYLNSTITQKPDDALAVGLSLFPLTAPVAMPMRMLSTVVPAWQSALALVLMIAGAVLVLGLIARLFRAQLLLRGTKASLKDIALALR
jgi:ABC-2 type transport system permease protein